jgi:IclR family pca regulon transcriptional regulator
MNTLVRSAARVLDLLELIATSEAGVSLTSAASLLHLPKSSALMLLRTLVARGYTARTEDDRYVLNEAFRRTGFGWGGNRYTRLMALARSAMQHLRDQVGETIVLGALDENGRVRLLAKAVARQDIRYDVDLAERLPAYCTAMGRIMLSSFDRDRRKAILTATPRTKRTPHTVTDLVRLDQFIEQGAVQGYAIVEEEFAVGGTGVSAPVVDADGHVIAALNVGCVTSRFAAKRQAVISAVVEEARHLSLVMSQTRGDRVGRRSRRRELSDRSPGA